LLDNNKKELLENNSFLTNRNNAKKKVRFNEFRFWLFIASVFVGFALIVVLYFISDYSKVYHVAIDGNVSLSDEYIRELSGINEDNRFLLVSKTKIKKAVEKAELIESAKVIKTDGNLIRIEVKEYEVIGYASENGYSYLVLRNGDTVELDENNMYTIARVPLIEGYDEEGVKKVAKAFKDIDVSIIEEISEIHHYPMSYDEDMMELVMKDGNYCFVSLFGLSLLDNYYSVVSELELNGDNVCLLIDEVTNTYQYRKCPWEVSEDTVTDSE